MTKQQKADLIMVLQAFQENKQTGSKTQLTDSVHRKKIQNLENAVYQILDILTT